MSATKKRCRCERISTVSTTTMICPTDISHVCLFLSLFLYVSFICCRCRGRRGRRCRGLSCRCFVFVVVAALVCLWVDVCFIEIGS